MWMSTNLIYIYIFRKSTIYPHPLCSCLLLCPLFATSPPTAGGGGGTQDILPKCVCLCVRADAPQCLKHHTDLSIWSPPSAIKTGIVYTGGEKSLPPFVSLSLSVCPPHLFYTQTACTDVPLSQNRECPLQRHLSARGVSGIVHSAVTYDGEEQGQLGLLCHVKPSRAFGATLFSPLILHHQSKNSPPMGLTSSFSWPLDFILLSTFFQHFLVIFLEFHQLVQL